MTIIESKKIFKTIGLIYKKEICNRILSLYEKMEEEGKRAILYNNDRLFVIKQRKFVDYCDIVIVSGEVSEQEAKCIKSLRDFVEDQLIPFDYLNNGAYLSSHYGLEKKKGKI